MRTSSSPSAHLSPLKAPDLNQCAGDDALVVSLRRENERVKAVCARQEEEIARLRSRVQELEAAAATVQLRPAASEEPPVDGGSGSDAVNEGEQLEQRDQREQEVEVVPQPRPQPQSSTPRRRVVVSDSEGEEEPCIEAVTSDATRPAPAMAGTSDEESPMPHVRTPWSSRSARRRVLLSEDEGESEGSDGGSGERAGAEPRADANSSHSDGSDGGSDLDDFIVADSDEGSVVGADGSESEASSSELAGTCSPTSRARGPALTRTPRTPRSARGGVTCPRCTLQNPARADACEVCGEWLDGSLACPECTLRNEPAATQCAACAAPLGPSASANAAADPLGLYLDLTTTPRRKPPSQRRPEPKASRPDEAAATPKAGRGVSWAAVRRELVRDPATIAGARPCRPRTHPCPPPPRPALRCSSRAKSSTS